MAKVWGTTWTIDTSGISELLLREGRSVRLLDLSQLQPGDEVGVSGRVSEDQPLLVRARVVRNYSIVTERATLKLESKFETDNEDKNEDKKKSSEGGSARDAAIRSIQDQIKQILDQIRVLQERSQGR